MKTWLKFGLILGLISVILDILRIIVSRISYHFAWFIGQKNFFISTEFLQWFASTTNLGRIIQLLIILISFVVYFLVGMLIGFLVSKMKKSN